MSNILLHQQQLDLTAKGLSEMKCRPAPVLPCTYVIGDLHANALKLIAFLLWSNIVTVTLEALTQICNYYYFYLPQGFSQDLEKTLQNSSAFNPNTGNIKLIFLGDTLCDRGNSDYMMLLLYKLMAINGVDFTIILSNHDLEFMRRMEISLFSPCKFRVEPVYSHDIDHENYERANYIYQEIYKSRLKAIEVDYFGGNNIIYSHAPCDLESIQTLSNISNSDIKAHVNTIDRNLSSLLNDNYINPRKDGVLHEFVWNYDIRRSFFPTTNYINVFGHIGEFDHTTNKPHILQNNQINLDTNLGKPYEYKCENGEHTPERSECYGGMLKILEVPRYQHHSALPHCCNIL